MFYGRQYLTQAFFKELAKRFKRNVVLILARRDGKVIYTTVYSGQIWTIFPSRPPLHYLKDLFISPSISLEGLSNEG